MPSIIDTHVFLWAALEPERLSPASEQAFAQPTCLSLVSVWEINLKFRTGKLQLALSPNEFVIRQLQSLELELLPIEMAHLALLATMPLHHRDPFDRLLIAQSLVEGMPLVSADATFDAYRELGVERVW